MSLIQIKYQTNQAYINFLINQKLFILAKQKILKKRIASYFGKSIKNRKVVQIRRQTTNIETFCTDNEVEALILENNLIKEHRPKFNILLKDDKTYPYVYFSDEHKFPSIALKRTKKSINSSYFGPYLSSKSVKESIKRDTKIFKLRNCNDSTFSSRSRLCIEHQMNRCSAPCVGNIFEEDYLFDLVMKESIASSNSNAISNIEKEMQHESNQKNYEKAAVLRDKIISIKRIQDEGSTKLSFEMLIFCNYKRRNLYRHMPYNVRNKKIRGTKTNLIKNYHQSKEEIYENIILNNYTNSHQLPEKIIISERLDTTNVIENALKIKTKKKIKNNYQAKKKNTKKTLSLCIAVNSMQIIKNHITKKEKYNIAFDQLEEILGFSKNKIENVECFDVSHISQSNAVTFCVVYSRNGAQKNQYRLFNVPKI